MAAGSLARIITTVATTPAARKIELKDLPHHLPANDDIAFDLITELLALGEAAPAALFVLPMWAAASAYLKDPQYYLNRHQPSCGESPSPEKHRPLEWRPLHHPLVMPRPDYRNPQLTDAERQKLVEWFRSEKTRGNFTGAEGLPKALPQDPKRDDSFGAPAEFRNAVMDVPRPNALPVTEVALPDLQLTDDRRRLMMGDAIPGRERSIGDFSGAAPHERSARDFMTPRSDPRPLSWLPDFWMGYRYSDLFKANNPGPAPSRVGLSPLPKVAPASPKSSDPQDRPRVRVPLELPHVDDLGAIESVFRRLAALCPLDEQGMMDTSPLRIGHDLTMGVEFQGGQLLSVQVLLKQHEAALRKWSAMQDKQPPALEGTFRSESRLMDVLRRVTGRKYLLSTRQAPIAKVMIKTDHQRVLFDKPEAKLTKVLRHAWENFEMAHGKMSIHAMQTSMVEARGGERVRLQDLMAVYWQGVQTQLKARKLDVPEDPNYHATEDGLDLIYFSLFDRVRIRSRWAGNLRAVALPFAATEPLPEVVTLTGALSVLYKLSQTSIMDGVDRFPLEPKGSLVVVYDPRTGRSFNYEKLMVTAYHMLAQGKADAQTARVFTEIVMPHDVVENPQLAQRQFPNEETRRSLLTFVRHHRGYPEVVVNRHLRGRGGVVETRRMQSLSPDATGSLPRAITQTYLSADQQPFFPSAMMARFITRLTHAHTLQDARVICNDMQARGLVDAASVGIWLERVVRDRSKTIEDDLKLLPDSKTLPPVVLPLVFNDVYLRLQAVIASSPKTQRRWEAYWKTGEMETQGTLPRFNRMRDFVLDEEARLDAIPRQGKLHAWRADSTQELSQPDPWVDVMVPKVFADAMARVLGAPKVKARAEDVTRAFMQLLPLDDVGVVQQAQGPTDTQNLVYTTLTGRPLEDWSEATLTPEQKQLRERMVAVGQAFGMIQFNDYWLGQGVKLAKRDGRIPPTLRIYLAIHPTWAAEALKALNEIYVGWKPHESRDVQFKMTHVPPELGRTDASLFYIDAANQGIFERVVALQEAHPEYLRPVQGPPTTAHYLKNGHPTGISVAEAPQDVRDSRNGVMSQLATRTLHLYRERLVRGQRLTQAEWVQIAAYSMQRAGIDLERPGFYAGTAERQPGWVIFADIFRSTDQYNAERDEPLLPRATPMYRSGGTTTTQVMGTARFAEDPFTSDPTRGIAFSKASPGPMVHRMSDGRGVPPSFVSPQPGGMRQNRSGPSHLPVQARISALPMQNRRKQVHLPQGRPVGALRLPLAILDAMQHPGVPEGKPKNYIPIGRVQQVKEKKSGATVTVWRMDENVLFMRSSEEGEDVMVCFETDELPGHPVWKLAIPLEDIRDLVRNPNDMRTIPHHVKGKKYSLVIKAHKADSGDGVDLLTVTPAEDGGIGAIIPWHARWMTESILDTIIGAAK